MPIHPNTNSNMDMRHPSSYMITPDYRIYQMNKRIQEYGRMKEYDPCVWWDWFTTEFFDENATLTMSFFLEDGPKRYTIGRTLIPRFYKTMFDSGIKDLSTVLHFAKEYHNSSTNTLTLDCDKATMVMQHDDPFSTKVCAEGHLIADFSEDSMRIKSWYFTIRSHLEYIPKHSPMQNPAMLEEMCKNITRAGFTPAVLNYLKMCIVIEPMKELMTRQKMYHMEPRDCLRNCLFQKWQKMLNPPTDTTRSTKRNQRKRKNSSTTNSTTNSQGARKKPFSSSDVMMVGEPTLMGQEFGEEDERMIQRLENNQFDNQMPVKSEDRETSSSFPSMSPPTSGTSQWQHQPTSSAIPTCTAVVPKSEPADPSSESTPPITTSM